MKKISLYFIAFVTLVAFIACDEDYTDWAAPQANEQEAPVTIAFQAANTSVTSFDLNTITTDSVEVAKQTSITKEEGTTVTYELQISKTTDYSENLIYGLSITGDMLKIATTDLQEAVVTLYGKRPVPRELHIMVDAYISTPEGQASRLQSNDLTIAVTPVAPFIDSAYYLIGDMNGWNGEALIKLGHSGADVYEDPVFSVMIEVPAPCYWKVIPQANVTAGNVWDNNNVLGCATDGDDALEGSLIIRSGDGPGAMKIVNAGWVRITLNMMEYTYTVEELGNISPYLYVAGNHQNWSPETAPFVYASDFVTYRGFISLDGGFKFCSERSWDGTNYGNGGSDKLSSTGGDLSVAAGFYFLLANMSEMTWGATEIKTIGLIGDATEGGWDVSTPMTFDPATVSYSVTTTLKAGSFKFRANDGWDINLGGNLSDLTFGGDNISATPGTYRITLKLAEADKYTATVVAQ